MDKHYENLLKEHASKVKGLMIAYIGERNRSSLVAHYNPANLNQEALANQCTEVLRSLTRLHGVATSGYTEPSYLVSSSLSERIMIQTIGDSSWYLAFVVNTKTNYQATVRVFKELLKACQLAPPV